jgi:ribonuclease E
VTARSETTGDVREERAPRPERGEQGERPRGPRGERNERRPAPVSEGGADEAPSVVQPFVDTVPVGEAAEGPQGERTGRRRRRGRGGRDRDEAQRELEGSGAETPVAEPGTEQADAAVEALAPADGEAPTPTAEGDERDSRRRRGGRDRQRRERRDEGAAVSTTEAGLVDSEVLASGDDGLRIAATVASETVAPVPAEPIVAAPTPVAVAAASAPVAPVVVVEPFVLPESDLSAIAQGAGLEWINSDAEKIRAVQEAMAREPKPVHVPRERKPFVRVDEGPLVLVETRKDLSQITLPFDTQAGQQPAAH